LLAEELYTYIPELPPASQSALENRFHRWTTRHNELQGELWLNYAIRDRKSLRYLGTVQATVMSPEKALIAYMVFPNNWRQGIASESCKALIESLGSMFGVKTIVAHVDTRNVASCKLLEALQFQVIAKIDGADIFKGAVSDEYVYQMTISHIREYPWRV
jgi:[ribosomal protein S5]-alanine N-acetyltransferase